MARAAIYQQLNQMATAQAYQDIYRLLSWMAMGMVLCAFLLSKNRPGQGVPKGEAIH
jgi:DHA2 family multidrug resistance protein